MVGDSPGGGSTTAWYKALLEKTGIQQVLMTLGVNWCDSMRLGFK